MTETLDQPQSQVRDEWPSFVTQTDWSAGYFNFGRAEQSHTDYFNPGLVERPDGLWLLTRRSIWEDRLKFGFNDVVAFKLGGPDGRTPEIGYKLKFKPTQPLEQIEDPRGIIVNGKALVSMCDFVWFRTKKWTGAHQVLMEFDQAWNAITRWDIPYGNNGKGVGLNSGHEKNWIYFQHEGVLYLLYQAVPLTIVELNESKEVVREYRTQRPFRWTWGEIRGGTPPVRIDDEYWTFFHSSIPWRGNYRRYVMGAYAFKASPPFEMTRMSKAPLLYGSQEDVWVEHKPCVVFPNGSKFLMDKSAWFLTMGINDLKCGWIEIPHRELVKRTVKV